MNTANSAADVKPGEVVSAQLTAPAPDATYPVSRAWSGPARAPEMVMRLYVAPFIDKDGNWIDPSVMYVPFGSQGWVAPSYPVSVQSDDTATSPTK